MHNWWKAWTSTSDLPTSPHLFLTDDCYACPVQDLGDQQHDPYGLIHKWKCIRSASTAKFFGTDV